MSVRVTLSDPGPRTTAWDYRDFLAAVKDGQFWIGSTTLGRKRVDRVPGLEELVEWAITGREVAMREMWAKK